MNKKYCRMMIMLFGLGLTQLSSCSGSSGNIYVIADTSTPDESVEMEFCEEKNIDDYPIIGYEEKEE